MEAVQEHGCWQWAVPSRTCCLLRTCVSSARAAVHKGTQTHAIGAHARSRHSWAHKGAQTHGLPLVIMQGASSLMGSSCTVPQMRWKASSVVTFQVCVHVLCAICARAAPCTVSQMRWKASSAAKFWLGGNRGCLPPHMGDFTGRGAPLTHGLVLNSPPDEGKGILRCNLPDMRACAVRDLCGAPLPVQSPR